MKKRFFGMGMLVLALVFGMMVFGCGEDPVEEDDNPPAVPTGLTGEAKSSSSVELRWNVVSNAENYRVQHKNGSNTNWQTSDDLRITPYTVTGLDASTAYDFRVMARNSNGFSDYSSSISVTTSGVSDPPAPTGVTATAVNGSSSSVKITWTAVTVTESYTPNYRVYYKKGTLAATPTDLAEATSSYPVSGTEYTVTGLDALTDYAFFIKATSSSIINPNGIDSGFGLAATAKTNVAKPANVRNIVVNNTTIKVTWDSVPSATSYKVYYKKLDDAFAIDATSITNATLFQTVTATTVDVTGLTYGNMYYFFVVPIGATGDGSYEYTGRLSWI
jgi:hypothetical protein